MIDKQYFLNQIDQYMLSEENGWGDSMVSTKYIYERLLDCLMTAWIEDIPFKVNELMDELAHNYKIDTGRDICE